MKKAIHVVPSLSGGWDVRKTGGERALKCFSTKTKAVAYGRKIGSTLGTDFYVHKRDGSVAQKFSPIPGREGAKKK